MPIKVKVDGTWRTVADAKPPKLGDLYGGGVFIGTFDEDYYLVAAENKFHVQDTSGSGNYFNKGFMAWSSSNAYYTTGASDSDDGIYNGQMVENYVNTNGYGLTYDHFPAFNYIKNFMNSGSGANGYTDWYMPSYEELIFILKNCKWFPRRTNIPFKFLDSSKGYWSSTEYSSSVAYDSPFNASYHKHRRFWYGWGFYYERFNKYWYGGGSITSYKNVLQGIIPVRRVDI